MPSPGALGRAAVAVSGLAAVAPLWSAGFLPFSDMPEQVAAIAMFRHWRDASWGLQTSYELAFRDSQYFLYHLVGAAVATLVGSAERANLVLLTAIGLAFPYSLRALLRSLDRDEDYALFGAPLFWSAPLLMGFVPYLASIPIVTWGMSLVVRHTRTPSKLTWVTLAGLALALFYLHMSGFVLFGMTAVLLVIVLRPGVAGLRALLRMHWLAPGALLACAWALRGSLAQGGPGASAAAQTSYLGARTLFAQLPVWAHDIWRSHVDEVCAIVLWASFLVLALARRDETARSPPLTRAAWVPISAALACYVALPYNVGAGAMLNTRLAIYVALYAPLLLPRVGGRARPLALGALFGASLLLSADCAYEIRRANRDELGDIERILDRLPRNARVVTLPFHVTSAHTHWPAWTFLGSYHVARAGGMSVYSFTSLRHWPIHVRSEVAPPEKRPFWTLHPCMYRNSTDGPAVDYVLARGRDPFLKRQPGPTWKKIDAEREWMLFEKTSSTNDELPAGTLDEGPCAP